jgi:DMSO/TMAO reductase YedYZ molybdopterin-dependent catalytic subunit
MGNVRAHDQGSLPRAAARGQRPPGAAIGALIGLLSAAAALGIAELAAAVFGAGSSPLIAVGGAVVDAVPEWLKGFAIRSFGESDKLVLMLGMVAIIAIVAAALGVASTRRPALGVIGLVVFGTLGVAAALTRPANGPIDGVPTILGTVGGLGAYRYLRRRAGLTDGERAPAAADAPRIRGFDRRRFFQAGLATAGLAAGSGALGRWLIARADASDSRAAAIIPAPADEAIPVPTGADLRIPGVTPFITPNARFYRVDTTLFVPAVDASTWSLRVHGMVEREITLDYEQLLARPLIERDITLACVSNEVGGGYIGNARWVGAPLRDLLEEAGVRPGADQLVSRSTDGFTVGTPTAVVMDGRDAMLAVAMNGEPLPLDHGFPVRMLVPGLYGYVSATKWLVDLELATFAAFDAYWIRRGWAQQAPIKTQSRIDTPRSSTEPSAGEVAVAGVAWAQHRGITRVEIRVDDGPWMGAELAAEDTVDTWRQWVFRWAATSGRHTLQVRATDGAGVTQTPERATPFPDGATGHHAVVVDVR